jgi:hypothetical protein
MKVEDLYKELILRAGPYGERGDYHKLSTDLGEYLEIFEK